MSNYTNLPGGSPFSLRNQQQSERQLLPLQPLNSRIGCRLFRFLLAVSCALANGLAVEQNLHLEGLVVVGAGLADELVAEHLAALPLHQSAWATHCIVLGSL